VPILSVGWALHLSRCAYLDQSATSHAFAINIVLPGASTTPFAPAQPSWYETIDNPPNVSVQEAWALGNFLFPWRWGGIGGAPAPTWSLWAFDPIAGTTRQVVAGLSPRPGTPVDNPQTLRTAFEDEIRNKIQLSDSVFSLADDHVGDQATHNMSLPHAIAPLTHLPAPISGSVLSLTGIIDVDVTANPIAANEMVACFPSFCADPANPASACGPDLPRSVVDHQYQAGSTPFFRAMCGSYQGASVVLYCNETDPRDTQRPGNPSINNSDFSVMQQFALTDLAITQLSPTIVAANALGTLVNDPALNATLDANQRGCLRTKLMQEISWGWERTKNSARGDFKHVLELYAKQSDLNNAFGNGWQTQINNAQRHADPNAIIPGLRKGAAAITNGGGDAIANLLSKDSDGSFWKTLSSALADLTNDAADANAEFAAAWAQVAIGAFTPDSAKRFYILWWHTTLPAADNFFWKQAVKYDRNNYLLDEIIRRAALGCLTKFPFQADLNAGNIFELLVKVVDEVRQSPAATPNKDRLVAWLKDSALQLPILPAINIPNWDANIQASAIKAVDNYVKAVQGHMNAKRVARDEGITIEFEGDAPADDEAMRGYAIALRSGISTGGGAAPNWDTARTQWITNTAAVDANKALLTSSVPPPLRTLWVAETVGSSIANGERIISIDYEGQPVSSVPARNTGAGTYEVVGNVQDFQDTKSIGYRWPLDERPLPMLGYGMIYQAASVAIDNTGGITDLEFRSSATELVDAAAIPEARWEPPGANISYVSREPPGAPTLITSPPPELYELNDETRGHAYDPKASKVAVLKPTGADADFYLPDVPDSLAIQIGAPNCHADFVERWLNTDVRLKEIGTSQASALLSDGNFSNANATAANLTTFRDATSKQIRGQKTGMAPLAYHPAVWAIGVAIWFDNSSIEDDPSTTAVIPLQKQTRLNPDGTLDLDPFLIELTIKAEPGQGENRMDAATVYLKPGSFARIRCYSLVEEKFFTGAGSLSRFSSDLGSQAELNELHASTKEKIPAFSSTNPATSWRTFGSLEFRFEVAPRWTPEIASRDLLSLCLKGPNVDSRNSAELEANFDKVKDAHWLRGLFLRHHEWHWSGHPVRLPAEDQDCSAWLGSFSQVASYRETINSLIPTNEDSGWRLGFPVQGSSNSARKSGICSLQLPAAGRPARYAIYTAQPIVRYRKLLNPNPASGREGPLALERLVFADGALLKGIPPGAANRLPAPLVKWAIPLTSTYQYDATKNGYPLDRTANGNILILDDAMRRTDSLARWGGVGDVLELDLLETRAVDFGSAGRRQLPEMGPNPIFHRRPDLDEPKTYKLSESDLFGCQYDIVRNGLVAQTAVVVTPSGGNGRWMMAKARARRLLLPETLIEDSLTSRGLGIYDLPQRADGEDVIPQDFWIDCSGALPSTLAVTVTVKNSSGNTVQTLGIDLPTLNNNDGPTRLLCTWHKGRWKGLGDPTWRIQVLAQKRVDNTMRWETSGKASCYSQHDDWSPCPGSPSATVSLSGLGTSTVPSVSIARVSDYTDPLWLTFIGTFGANTLGRADEYKVEFDPLNSNTGIKLVAKNSGSDSLTLNSPPASPADWATDKVKFQLLLIFKPLVDISLGKPDTTAGQLIGWYRPDTSSGNGAFVGFPEKSNETVTTASLEGCYAYLCSFQRISAPSDDEKQIAIVSWESLLAAMFPSPTNPATKESIIRPLPEYLGPIKFVNKSEN